MKLRMNPRNILISALFPVEDPFERDELLNLLKEGGFEEVPPSEREVPIPELPQGVKLNISLNAIAKKEEVLVNYDPQGKVGVRGDDFSKVGEIFAEVKSLIESNYPRLYERITYFEHSAVVRVSIKEGKTPLQEIGNFLGFEKFSRFNKIIGEEVAPFCIRFYPKEKMEVIKNLRKVIDWFDFYIYPEISNPRVYSLRIVFRKEEFTKVKEFTEECNEKIIKIIKIISEE